MSRNPRSFPTGFAVAVAYLLVALTAACALTPSSGGQGATTAPAIPSVSPPPVQSPPVPARTTPGPLTGATAITPHLNAVPAFTTQDMADYAKGHLPGGSGSGFTIVRNEFLPSQDVNGLLGSLLASNASVRAAYDGAALRSDGSTLGFLEAQGSFPFPNGVPDGALSYPYAFEVFDAKTGNLLMYGGLNQPVAAPTSTPTPQPPTPVPTHTPAPKLHVSADSSAFCLNGQYPNITVTNSGGGTLTWSAKPSSSGMMVSPSSGTLSASETQIVTVSGSAPPPTESVSFTSNGGNATITYNCT